MNVLVVSQFSADNAGNYIATLLDLDQFLNEKGDHCFFAFPEDAKKQDWIRNFEVEKLLFLEAPRVNRFKYSVKVLQSISAFVQINSIDLVHSNFDGYDYACAKICEKYKIPLVVSFHDSIVRQKNILKNLYQNLMLQIHYRWHTRKALIVFVNRELEAVKEKLGIRNSTVVNNGISLRRFTYITNMGKCMRGGGITHLLMIAGVRFEVKGVDCLLDYMRDCNVGSIFVDIVGNGVTAEKIKEFNDPRVNCIHSENNMNELYHRYDAFISLSKYETFSYAIAEAMYVGLPIIKSNCFGTSWADNQPSVSVVENNTEFFEAIKRIHHINECERERSSNFIKQNYSNEMWCNKIYDIYRESVSKV